MSKEGVLIKENYKSIPPKKIKPASIASIQTKKGYFLLIKKKLRKAQKSQITSGKN